jgi:acetoacetyl-CoA reductase
MSRIALVTGGTRGIGAAISQDLHAKGYRVIASYAKNHASAESFAKASRIDIIPFDVSNEAECVDACAKIEKQFGPIEVLVHNAGITADSTIAKMKADQWHKVIETNLDSCFYLTRAVLTGMKHKGFGRLIYLSSVNALKGQRGQSNYSATKAAIIGFAKSIALETAKIGVTANVIAPGYIDTEMVRAVPENILEQIVGQIPVGRLGTADEIAHVVSFLADERSAFITGATISANGGMY